MPDNVTANPGSGGATFASNDVSGVQFTRVKIALGADGEFDGDVSGANPVPVSDAGGSLTVDGTVTASNAAGDVAHDAADSGNPIKVGVKAANALPTAVANADRANAISDLFGRLLVSHIDPAMQVWKSANFTTTQTGGVIWTPGSGKKVVLTRLVVATYGTTGGRLILYFGSTTTYTPGTSQLVLAFSAVPSATLKPGVAENYVVPVFAVTADHSLRLTTDAAVSVDITAYGYEI
jgi:hypothetical protein